MRSASSLASLSRRAGILLGLLADLGRRLTSGAEHACGLLAEQAGQCGVVEPDVVEVGVRLRRAQLTFEESLTLLQPTELRGDHAQEVLDLVLVEAATTGAERGLGDRRR